MIEALSISRNVGRFSIRDPATSPTNPRPHHNQPQIPDMRATPHMLGTRQYPSSAFEWG